MEEETTSPINLPTLPPINEKDLNMNRNLPNTDAGNRKKLDKASLFDLFIKLSSTVSTNSDMLMKVMHDLVTSDIVPESTNTSKGQRKDSSTTNNMNIRNKQTNTAVSTICCKSYGFSIMKTVLYFC